MKISKVFTIKESKSQDVEGACRVCWQRSNKLRSCQKCGRDLCNENFGDFSKPLSDDDVICRRCLGEEDPDSCA